MHTLFESLFGTRFPTEHSIRVALDGGRLHEHRFVELKGSRAVGSSTKLCKDISAFANSEGGVLLLGVDEKTRSIEPVSEAKETVQSLIDNGIKPRCESHVFPISLAGGGTIYAIEVAQSERLPHMVVGSGNESFRYFTRRGSKSEPMTHDEIEAAFLRRGLASRPKLSVSHGEFDDTLCARGSETLMIYVGNDGTAEAVGVTVLVTTRGIPDFGAFPQLPGNFSKFEGAREPRARLVLADALYPGEHLAAMGLTFHDVNAEFKADIRVFGRGAAPQRMGVDAKIPRDAAGRELHDHPQLGIIQMGRGRGWREWDDSEPE